MGPRPDDVVHDLLDEPLPLGGRQERRGRRHQVADLLGDVGVELFLAQRRVEQPEPEPGEQRLVGPGLHLGHRVDGDRLGRRTRRAEVECGTLGGGVASGRAVVSDSFIGPSFGAGTPIEARARSRSPRGPRTGA